MPGDAARPSPHVHNSRTFDSLRQFERRLYDMFRLRTRNQHRRRDQEIQSPEFLMTDDVLRRDTSARAPQSPPRNYLLLARSVPSPDDRTGTLAPRPARTSAASPHSDAAIPPQRLPDAELPAPMLLSVACFSRAASAWACCAVTILHCFAQRLQCENLSRS